MRVHEYDFLSRAKAFGYGENAVLALHTVSDPGCENLASVRKFSILSGIPQREALDIVLSLEANGLLVRTGKRAWKPVLRK